VPTWNYVAVHAEGSVRALSRDELAELLRALTDQFEGPDHPRWSVSDVPSSFIEELLAEIAGFEVQVERLDAKLKLSQNREVQDRQRVAAQLQRSSRWASRDVAAWMKAIGNGHPYPEAEDNMVTKEQLKEEIESVQIETQSPGAATVRLDITGANIDLRSPEKIQKLMDLLELPQGSRAIVKTITSVAVPR
jgi:hypothetical protein